MDDTQADKPVSDASPLRGEKPGIADPRRASPPDTKSAESPAIPDASSTVATTAVQTASLKWEFDGIGNECTAPLSNPRDASLGQYAIVARRLWLPRVYVAHYSGSTFERSPHQYNSKAAAKAACVRHYVTGTWE